MGHHSKRAARWNAWAAHVWALLRGLWQRFTKVWRRIRGSRAGKVATVVAALAVTGAAALYLAPGVLAGLSALTWATLRQGAGWLAGSVALTTASVLLGAPVLRAALDTLGLPLPAGRSQVIQTTSNLAGYVPGVGWRYLGKAYLLSREGIPATTIALAMSIEFVEIMVTGLLMALALWPAGAEAPIVGVLNPGARFGGLAGLVVIMGLAPTLLRLRVARPSGLWRAAGLSLAAWTLFGLGFGCLARALVPLTAEGWRVAVAALAISFAVSNLAVFVPGGLGVRDGILAALLAVAVPPETAALAAVASRVAGLACEVLAFAMVRVAVTLARRRCAGTPLSTRTDDNV